MKSQITITTLGDTLRIVSPYSETNNATFRSKGGQYDRDSRSWVFANTQATHEMIESLWGETSQLVRVRLNYEDIVTGKEWQTGGYKLAHRRDRDAPVEMAPTVRLESGTWQAYGGSRNHPVPKCIDDEITLSVVVNRSYAEANNLEIINEVCDEEPENVSRFLSYSDDEIYQEAVRRGFQINH